MLFRLGSHRLPVVVGHVAARRGGGRGGEGGQHDARADRVCTHCSHIATADALHIILRCPVLKPLQHCHAAAFP